jgi:cyclopropane fatty-acyl-phospholipid synthase-like methyltransferase
MGTSTILKVSEERWQLAQREEQKYWSEQGWDGNDANEWWQEQFEDYKFLAKYMPESLLEVGCGPFAQNTRRIISIYPINDLGFEDPLLADYIKRECAVMKIVDEAHFCCKPIEEMQMLRRFDVIVCINVLDHVRDVELCFERMHAHLNHGGILIIGNALSNDEDQRNCPESWTDSKHPMKMDLESLAPFLFKDYQSVFLKILPRNHGRNPKAHYATLLWAGKKL